MIRINLLPIERRKTERTPVPRLMMICAIAAAAALMVVGGFGIFMEFQSVNDDILTLQAKLQGLSGAVKEHTALTKEKASKERQVKEIKDMAVREPEKGYWYAINGLWDVIHAHPKVWIDNLRILTERSVSGQAKNSGLDKLKPPIPYGVAMSCHVASGEVSEMTKFREALKNHPVLQETLYFINIDVEWNVSDEDDFGPGAQSISFDVALFAPNVKPKRVKAKTPEEKAAEASGKAPSGGTQ